MPYNISYLHAKEFRKRGRHRDAKRGQTNRWDSGDSYLVFMDRPRRQDISGIPGLRIDIDKRTSAPLSQTGVIAAGHSVVSVMICPTVKKSLDLPELSGAPSQKLFPLPVGLKHS